MINDAKHRMTAAAANNVNKKWKQLAHPLWIK